VNEGSTIALSLTGAADPSPADTATGFTYAFDCGDGSGYGSFGPVSSASCVATASGAQTVRAKVRDKDGGTTEYTATVAINRLPTPPVVTPGPAQTATEGAATSFNLGSFTDTAADGPWAVDVNWGDGSAHATLTMPAAGAVSAQPHTYTAAGTYTVTVTVTDKDGASGSATFSVSVAPPGACQPLTWLAPADGTNTIVPVNTMFTIRFSWGDCSRFIHDESVIIQVENPDDPTMPVTSWVYGRDITIDDAAGEYRVDFIPELYGLAPGTTLTVTVYIGDQMVGQALLHLARPRGVS
ncbi:MAG: hypothetical protein JWN15_3053, partial [Firmicutes bacterium]|nr:hypothetical protein [Bacillota bacterium]